MAEIEQLIASYEAELSGEPEGSDRAGEIRTKIKGIRQIARDMDDAADSLARKERIREAKDARRNAQDSYERRDALRKEIEARLDRFE